MSLGTDPDAQGWMAKALAAMGVALTALATWAWNHTHKRIDGKAEMKTLDDLARRVEDHTISRGEFDQHAKSDEQQLAAIGAEIGVQRNNIGKLFDKIDEAVDRTEVRFVTIEKQSFERHVELLNAIHALKK